MLQEKMADMEQVPVWDGKADTLEKFKEGTAILVASTPENKCGTCGPRILGRFPQGSMQRAIGIEMLKKGTLQKDDGPHKLYEAIYETLGTQVETGVATRFAEFIRKRGRQYEESMQHYLAEEERLYARALAAVQLVAPDVKELICSPLRGYLLLEQSSLTSAEQVIIYGDTEKSYKFPDVKKSLREMWGNEEKLKQHDRAWASASNYTDDWDESFGVADSIDLCGEFPFREDDLWQGVHLGRRRRRVARRRTMVAR